MYRLLHLPSGREDLFLPACKYHIILLGNVEELLKKLDIFCFTYQHVDCLYTLLKYRLGGKNIATKGQVFDNVQRGIDLIRETREWTECRALLKRNSCLNKKIQKFKKFKQLFMSALQDNKSTQTSGSVFTERIEKVKKTEVELELIEIVDCFLDGLGNYDSNLIAFRIKSL